MQNLSRRGGIWWARLVVPQRLRAAAGRREFIQSCKTHEHKVAKLVAAVLLAGWRRQLLALESVAMSFDVLKIAEGAPVLLVGGHLQLGEAAAMIGVSPVDLLRAAAAGRLDLYCRLQSQPGHLVQYDTLELLDVERGVTAGVVVPNAAQMPDHAIAFDATGVFRVTDNRSVAGALLAEGHETADLILFESTDQPGWCFAPGETIRRRVHELEVLGEQVEAIRAVMAASVSSESLEHARAARMAALVPKSGTAGKWASKLFSEAVNEYCSRSNGLRATLAGEQELRQRKAGLMIFAEFMGDRQLGEIDADMLRAFRDGPLKEIPDHANRLKKGDRRDTMRETIEALKLKSGGYPGMTTAQRMERMRWLFRLFGWLKDNDLLIPDPSLAPRC